MSSIYMIMELFIAHPHMLTYLRLTTTLCDRPNNNYANFTEAQRSEVIFPKLCSYFSAKIKCPVIFPLCCFL